MVVMYDELIAEARRRYPVGTAFFCVEGDSGRTTTSKGLVLEEPDYRINDSFDHPVIHLYNKRNSSSTNNYDPAGYLYVKGNWAPINSKTYELW